MPPRPPPLPHLPPLPHGSTWLTYFPRRFLANSNIDPAWVLRNRVSLTRKEHCDAFVREIGIRPGEVIVEVNPGPGQLTRSLLEGGAGVDDADAWKSWDETQASTSSEGAEDVPLEGNGGTGDKLAKWPSWPREAIPDSSSRRLKAMLRRSNKGSSTIDEPANEVIKPAVVVVSEPSLSMLEHAFDYPTPITPSRKQSLSPSQSFPPATGSPSDAESLDAHKFEAFAVADHTQLHFTPFVRSPHRSNLILSESSAYRWPTLPTILNDPLLEPYLSVTSSGLETTSQGASVRREWEAEPPHITVVATMPDGVNGEQLLAQWIGSAVGGEDGRQWLWQWGRVRLAILCGKGLYDRIMARPREMINCKLSIMTSALFYRRPMTPHHHVANVDKAGKRTTSTPIFGSLPHIVDPTEGEWSHPPTVTLPTDFFPAIGSSLSSTPLSRPALMGIMLTPRLTSPILPSQKDAWDYVLRNCFIREVQPIGEAAKNLGFAAENLVPRFADDKEGHEKRWRGTPVKPNVKVKDLTNDQWARVVDVFYKWPFKPESLMLATDITMDSSRELGVD